MATHEQDTAAPTPAPAPPVPMIDAAAPAAPLPFPVGGMVVGHAEDRAEVEADQMADSALSRLARLTGDTHQHGPGCDHVRRSAAPAAGGAVVGHEGGALDTETSSVIERMRGGGRGLEEPVRRRMETAFGTSLSGVRIHDGSTAAGLNAAVSARAFTTGSDIFFGRGEYAPDTRSGERVLAHELAHTLQPESAVGRLVRTASVVRRTGGKDEPAPPRPAWSETPSVPGSAPAPQAEHPVSTPVEAVTPADRIGPSAQGHEVDDLVVEDLDSLQSDLVELLTLDDAAAMRIADERGADTPLRIKMLMKAFEADWFKAKDCLVFRQWPGHAKPNFNQDTSLALMKGLLKLRDEIHAQVQPLAQVAMKDALGAEAGALANNEFLTGDGPAKAKLAEALQDQGGQASLPTVPGKEKTETEAAVPKIANQHVDYMDAAGAESVTSDLDISTGGMNTEIAVRVYNEQFRKRMGTSLDPGTVFDLNVYAMDFIHGSLWNDDKTELTPKSENSTAIESSSAKLASSPLHQAMQKNADAENQAAADRMQDVYALTHIARFLKGKEWDDYAASVLAGVSARADRAVQKRLLTLARSKADEFEETIKRTIAKLVEADGALASVGVTSSWRADDGGTHYADNAKRMRAANHVYEKKLIQVKALRQQVSDLVKANSSKPADIAQLRLLISQVAESVSEASLYANEVYGSAGATVHAVIAVQGGRKRQKLNEAEAKRTAEAGDDPEKLANLRATPKDDPHLPRAADKTKVTVHMSTESWKQAFTDNLGDVLKDYEHYGHSIRDGQTPNYPYAAFKMGKYVDRMVDSVLHLEDALSPDDMAKVRKMPELVALTSLGEKHVEAKAGKGGDDPSSLAKEGHFKDMGKADIDTIKRQAIKLSATVRAMWVNDASTADPDRLPDAVPSPSGPPSAGASVAPVSAPVPDPGPVPEPGPSDTQGQARSLHHAGVLVGQAASLLPEEDA